MLKGKNTFCVRGRIIRCSRTTGDGTVEISVHAKEKQKPINYKIEEFRYFPGLMPTREVKALIKPAPEL